MARPQIPEGRTTRLALAGLAGLAAVKAVALVLLMGALAHALAQWAGGASPDTHRLLVQGAGGAGLMAVTVWGQSILARRAALGTKEELRARLVEHRLGTRPGAATLSPSQLGAEAMLASRGLDGLDNYFTSYLPALVSCAVLPVMVGLQILISDWVSALIVVLTLPLVPVFMVLIGFHTQERVQLAARGLDRLSNHLLELARGLPVLVGLRRAAAQRRALDDVCESYRVSTMATLRTAFLSSMALELISTISVAVVAVFVGVRLVYGDLPLEAGLLALMLAPECFRPLRDVGAAHHGSEDGVEALRRVRLILGGVAQQADPNEPRETAALKDDDLIVTARDFTVFYPGRSVPAVHGFNAALTPGAALVLDTPSGTGKSTMLAAMAGMLGDGTAHEDESPRWSGQLTGPAPETVVFVSQHPVFTEETVLDEVRLHAAGPLGAGVEYATVMQALSLANAAHLVERTVVECSPGELRRIAVARALARAACDPGIELALFDEPTAHLDPVSAAAVRQAVAGLLGSVAVVVATHDPELASMLRTGGGDALATVPTVSTVDLAAAAPTLTGHTTKAEDPAEPAKDRALSWRHIRALPLLSPRFAAGVVLSALATLSAAALSGISGWLIVWAAAQPPMLYLMTLIVGVRAFGVGRSVLRYCERLMTHDAVFRWSAHLRLKLWDSLGSSVTHWGRLSRSGGALGTLVADVDELRDAVPRAVVPIPAAILSCGAVFLTLVLLVPETAWIVVVLSILGLLVVPLLVLTAQRRASAAAAVHRIWLAERVTTLFSAAVQLSVNGVGRVLAERFAARDARIARPLKRLAWADGLGQGAVTLLTSLAAVAAAGTAMASGADPRAAAVAALLMLALQEPLGQLLEAVSALPALAALMERTLPLLDAQATVLQDESVEDHGERPTIASLELEEVAVRYPGSPTLVLDGVSGKSQRGSWWTVSGPSGAGKSTLLAVLLGFLRPERGRYLLDGKLAQGKTLSAIAWCPQDSYLFNSTLRANLAIALPSATPPDERLLEEALTTVGLGPWLAELPQGLDTRVGAGGHNLSGGQRTRVSVARTLVAGADVVLLDEPTAHLGADESRQLVTELHAALSGKAVVMVTHDPQLAAVGEHHLRLDRARVEVGA